MSSLFNSQIPLTFFAITSTLFAKTGSISHSNIVALSLSENTASISLDFQFDSIQITDIPELLESFASSSEGSTYEFGQPILPAISRFVVVPPDVGLQLEVESGDPEIVKSNSVPLHCQDAEIAPNEREIADLYPAEFAEMSTPVVIRGVRLVKITTYPIQWDADLESYLIRDHINTQIKYTSDAPVNPAKNPSRRYRSHEFLKFIDALAENGDIVGRDDPPEAPKYVGHYLVVANQNVLVRSAPFIEWRRKAGYRVDILALSSNQANSAETVKQQIDARYNRHLNNGEDPFEYILLIGDRMAYSQGSPRPGYTLDAYQGNPTFRGPTHADYRYACCEGNDNIPDVAIGRFPIGSDDLADLVIGRTLAYEANPQMQNPQWFERASTYSQHWGNDENSAWHVTIHTTVRWGEQVLRNLGFDRLSVYENMNWDRDGSDIGPFLRERLNEGCNLMIGRAENYFWRRDFNGVNRNTVFPINICISGHGEEVAYNMFRNGSGNDMKGPSAGTFCWGVPPTATSNYLWLQTVNGFLVEDMPLGWARTFAVTALEKHFPNFRTAQGNQPVYLHTKTDYDLSGDPGIKFWKNQPIELSADFPDAISPSTRSIEVRVTDPQNGHDFSGATVTLYAPGNIPLFNAANYAAWDRIISQTATTGSDGMVRFVLDDDESFTNNTHVYLTVTGREIKPIFGDVTVRQADEGVELVDWNVHEIEGNGDGECNQGESIEIELTAHNIDRDDEVVNVTAIARSTSPYLTVGNDRIVFGNIAADRNSIGNIPVRVEIDASAPDGVARFDLRPIIDIEFCSGDVGWTNSFKMDIVASHLGFESNDIPILNAGENEVDIAMQNDGRARSELFTARLVSQNPAVLVIDSDDRYPPIEPGGNSGLSEGGFTVSYTPLAIPGNLYQLSLIIENESGLQDTLLYPIQAGRPTQNSPLGPDRYGYICLDDTDDDWPGVPRYDWIEINPDLPNADYEGSQLPFRGQSPYNIGEAVVVPLGFETQFYGQFYDSMTVTTNGFIVPGNHPGSINFQNWPLDQGIGAGLGVIAPLWDDLRLRQGSGIYTFHDELNHRFIIEWYRMSNSRQNLQFTFEVILYDREFWPTVSGDQNILFQYAEFHADRNVRNNETEWEEDIPFASVGISNPNGIDGINYCYNNTYPLQAEELASRRALFFTTSLYDRFGSLWGTVRDMESGNPINEATISTSYGVETLTDDNGRWEISMALAEVPFRLSAMKVGFNDSTKTGLLIHEGDSVSLDFQLRHPELRLDTDQFDLEIGKDSTAIKQLTISNNGNGPLEFRISANYDLRDHIAGKTTRNDQPGQADESWIEFNPDRGVVAPDSRSIVAISFAPAELDTGIYQAEIIIDHNSIEARTVIPVWLEVLPANLSQNDSADLPNGFSLLRVYPNPFNSSLQIEYTIEQSGLVELIIFDTSGRIFSTLASTMQSGGKHILTVQADTWSAGIYFCRLTAGNRQHSNKILLIK